MFYAAVQHNQATSQRHLAMLLCFVCPYPGSSRPRVACELDECRVLMVADVR